jgi:hypothetical protein
VIKNGFSPATHSPYPEARHYERSDYQNAPAGSAPEARLERPFEGQLDLSEFYAFQL